MKSMPEDSDIRKCIIIYDYLKYVKTYVPNGNAFTASDKSASLSDQEKNLANQ